MEIWEVITHGTLWATPGLLRDCFTGYVLRRCAKTAPYLSQQHKHFN